ncbi:hypothetical protein [Bythopirellula goksoeyrii]|uniref:Uncharacterized protein n=1 Tax=Bythopirellula goksoeyrii TaxID=1400387 RepID=A0A5B9QDY4_9BACT|nr:hypothetical protein [Bythopirellula goksoeyrii]QEG36019.1 hypothetical protein Pr1d_33280 [Bythopirellula goksoeyrii]
MSYRKLLGMVLLASGFVVSLGQLSTAQVARYQPRTPTLSPYLNLGRFNGGGLPNYFALVRPQIRQREFNVQAETLARRQATEITQIQNEVQRDLIPTAATGTGSWFMTPGTQNEFLNTRSFYPEPLQRVPRR